METMGNLNNACHQKQQMLQTRGAPCSELLMLCSLWPSPKPLTLFWHVNPIVEARKLEDHYPDALKLKHKGSWH